MKFKYYSIIQYNMNVEDSVGTVVQFTINEVSKGEQLCSSGEVNWSKGSNMIGYNTQDGR